MRIRQPATSGAIAVATPDNSCCVIRLQSISPAPRSRPASHYLHLSVSSHERSTAPYARSRYRQVSSHAGAGPFLHRTGHLHCRLSLSSSLDGCSRADSSPVDHLPIQPGSHSQARVIARRSSAARRATEPLSDRIPRALLAVSLIIYLSIIKSCSIPPETLPPTGRVLKEVSKFSGLS